MVDIWFKYVLLTHEYWTRLKKHIMGKHFSLFIQDVIGTNKTLGHWQLVNFFFTINGLEKWARLRLPIFLFSIRLGWNFSSLTNTLAYLFEASLTQNESVITLTRGCPRCGLQRRLRRDPRHEEEDLHVPPTSKGKIQWPWGHNIQYNGTQHNDTRHNGRQRKGLFTTLSIMTISINDTGLQHSTIMLSVIMLSVTFYLKLCWVSLFWMSLSWVSLCIESWPPGDNACRRPYPSEAPFRCSTLR
jgi:hypothetical protein